jgi:hypothetical protein
MAKKARARKKAPARRQPQASTTASTTDTSRIDGLEQRITALEEFAVKNAPPAMKLAGGGGA